VVAGREIVRVTTIVTPDPDHVDHLLLTAEFEGGGYATVEFSEHSFAYEVTVESKPNSAARQWLR
jgi:hypothetical protein